MSVSMTLVASLVLLASAVASFSANAAQKRDPEIEKAIKRLRSPDEATVTLALPRLAELREEDKPVVARLMQLVSDREPRVRESCRAALQHLEPELHEGLQGDWSVPDPGRHLEHLEEPLARLRKLGAAAAPAGPMAFETVQRALMARGNDYVDLGVVSECLVGQRHIWR